MIRKTSGMTMIELIFAMLVTGILLGYGAVKYLDFNKTQTVKNDSLNIRNELRRIQGRALAGVKPAVCSTSRLEGYQVNFLNNDATYCPGAACITSQAVCDGTVQGDIGIYLLTPGFTFALPVPGTLTFFTLAGGIDTNGQLTVKGYEDPNDVYYRICLTQGGDIKDCGFQKDTPLDWATCGGCP